VTKFSSLPCIVLRKTAVLPRYLAPVKPAHNGAI